MQSAERVDVLELGLHAKLCRAGPADRDVRLGAQLALFHLGFRRADRPEQGAERDGVVAGFVGGPQVRLAHDLHQRRAGSVQVDERLRRLVQLVAGVDELARVLLQVDAPDADAPAVELEMTVDAHREVVLADLVALRQVGIHVVLAIELRVTRNLTPERDRGLEAGLDRRLVDHGQHPRKAQADLADVGVRRVAEPADGAAAEHLAARGRLHVHLHADDDLPRRARQEERPPPSLRSRPHTPLRPAGRRPRATGGRAPAIRPAAAPLSCRRAR